MISNVIDQPANKDRLNMRAYADALTEFIANAQSPLTIALQGEWGSGKTSLMNALKQNLVDKEGAPYLGVWINTWQYALMSDAEAAIRNILHGIIGQVAEEAKTTEEERKSLFSKIARIGGGVFSDIFKKYSGVDAERIVKELSVGETAPDKSSVENLKDELARLVKKAIDNNKGKRGFLFFIDDLDRIDPPIAVQILELLKNIFDLENCIFVLAIDYGVVVKGLKPKFGAMTPENEREFRSFFDKIIQLPFSMPVSNYKIDGFLMDSLCEIGYIDAKEKDDKSLCEAITYYALQSVGTNPRSLKRLINYLSLIKLVIARTPDSQDDADFAAWKDILFALVSLQIQYPKVYEALQGDSDFPGWGEAFEQKWQIPALKEGEKEKLAAVEEFDEPWEQMLFRFCRRDTFLEARSLNISRILNRIRARITVVNKAANEIGNVGNSGNIGDTVEWLLRLSAVTSVKSEQVQTDAVENFSKSEYLKSLRWHALKMREVTLKKGRLWDAALSDVGCIYSWQKRVQTNLECSMWLSRKSVREECGDYITAPMFHIFHDGKSFQLKMWGEFWGAWPKEKYKGIDFTADDIQANLAKAEAAIGKAFDVFGKTVNCGHNPQNIWWNVTIPFASHDELVSEEFSQNLCGSLARLAGAFSGLLGYRIQTTTPQK